MRFWSRMPKQPIPDSARIGISLVTYNQPESLPALIHSIKCQTFKNYKIYIFHDGPWLSHDHARKCLGAIDKDPRFEVTCTESRANKFGHNLRQPGFDLSVKAGCSWLGTMNADCWYAPVYFEWMLMEACKAKAEFVYCNMVHSHKMWGPIKTAVRRGFIDAGSWLASARLCSGVKWDGLDFAADWSFIEKLSRKPEFKTAKVDGYLFTHN